MGIKNLSRVSVSGGPREPRAGHREGGGNKKFTPDSRLNETCSAPTRGAGFLAPLDAFPLGRKRPGTTWTQGIASVALRGWNPQAAPAGCVLRSVLEKYSVLLKKHEYYIYSSIVQYSIEY